MSKLDGESQKMWLGNENMGLLPRIAKVSQLFFLSNNPNYSAASIKFLDNIRQNIFLKGFVTDTTFLCALYLVFFYYFLSPCA